MKIKGKLIATFDTEVKSEKFSVRDFVIESSRMAGDYEIIDKTKFQLKNDRCSLIDKFSYGEEIEVDFNIRGIEYERNGNVNYFVSLEAWGLSKVDNSAAPPPPAEVDDTDDLPF